LAAHGCPQCSDARSDAVVGNAKSWSGNQIGSDIRWGFPNSNLNVMMKRPIACDGTASTAPLNHGSTPPHAFSGAFISCGLMLYLGCSQLSLWLMHIMWTLKTPAVNAKIMLPKWWMLVVLCCVPGVGSPQGESPHWESW